MVIKLSFIPGLTVYNINHWYYKHNENYRAPKLSVHEREVGGSTLRKYQGINSHETLREQQMVEREAKQCNIEQTNKDNSHRNIELRSQTSPPRGQKYIGPFLTYT